MVAAITVPDGDAVAPVTPSPDPDGTITVFTIQPYTAGASVVYLDGVCRQRVADYTEIDAAAGTIQFAVAPPAGSTISTPPPPLTFNVVQGQTVTLNGASSSGDIDSYAWSQTGGTGGCAPSAERPIASFTAPSQETSMTFQLVVTRNAPPATDTQEVVINVVGGQPAVANAGPDQTVAPGGLVQLDGRGSTAAVSYAWTQLPGGTAVTLERRQHGDAVVHLPGRQRAADLPTGRDRLRWRHSHRHRRYHGGDQTTWPYAVPSIARASGSGVSMARPCCSAATV